MARKRRYKPRSDANPTPGGTGFLHYSSDGKYVTVASGKGDPSKDILVPVFKAGRRGAFLVAARMAVCWWTTPWIRSESRPTSSGSGRQCHAEHVFERGYR